MLIPINFESEKVAGDSVIFKRAPGWQIIAMAALFLVLAIICLTSVEPRGLRLPFFVGLFVGAIICTVFGGRATEVLFDRGRNKLVVKRKFFAWCFKRQVYDYDHVDLSIQVLTNITSRGNAPRAFQGYVITAGPDRYLLGLPPRIGATDEDLGEVRLLLGFSTESSSQTSHRIVPH